MDVPAKFNPNTASRYVLPNRSHVTLTVFNTLGQQAAQLVNGDMEAGHHQVQFDAAGLSSGVYFYTFTFERIQPAWVHMRPESAIPILASARTFPPCVKMMTIL